MRKRTILGICLLLISSGNIFGQEVSIKIPQTKDRYAAYVKQLEEGKTDIDYTDFRHSFLESKAYADKDTNYDDLKKQLFAAARDRNYSKVVEITRGMLSIDYTSMFAHKYLQQTYKILGDSLNQNKYHDIEFGLLNSIVKSGDGRTCETGWHVTQIEEEYFILQMLGHQFQQQSITQGGKNTCDELTVKAQDGETKNYFFEANKVFEMEEKMFKN